MKKIIICTVVFAFFSQLKGQEMELKGIYGNSSYNKYHLNTGVSIGYNRYFPSGQHAGLSFSYLNCQVSYDDIHISGADPFSYLIDQVDPVNIRVALKANYVFRLVGHSASALYLGPEIGINYFSINESYNRIENGSISGGEFDSDYRRNNRFSIGLLLDFELNELIHKDISAFISVNPEITAFEKFATTGSDDPYLILWMNMSMGLRYNFNGR